MIKKIIRFVITFALGFILGLYLGAGKESVKDLFKNGKDSEVVTKAVDEGQAVYDNAKKTYNNVKSELNK